MSIIYTETKSDKDSRTEINIGDGRSMTVNITGEGIIIDAYGVQEDDDNGMIRDDLHLGTIGMTFDEWAEWITESKGQFNKDSRTERWTIVDDSIYVIAHIGLVDGEQLYWSNKDGWGSIQTADRWTKDEYLEFSDTDGYHLPSPRAAWIPEATAIKDPNNTDPWD